MYQKKNLQQKHKSLNGVKQDMMTHLNTISVTSAKKKKLQCKCQQIEPLRYTVN